MKKERDEEREEWESKGGVEKREEREGEWEREVLFLFASLIYLVFGFLLIKCVWVLYSGKTMQSDEYVIHLKCLRVSVSSTINIVWDCICQYILHPSLWYRSIIIAWNATVRFRNALMFEQSSWSHLNLICSYSHSIKLYFVLHTFGVCKNCVCISIVYVARIVVRTHPLKIIDTCKQHFTAL